MSQVRQIVFVVALCVAAVAVYAAFHGSIGGPGSIVRPAASAAVPEV